MIDAEPISVKLENQGTQYICRVEYEGQKSAAMIYASAFPFGICAEMSNGENVYKNVSSPFFPNLISEILEFFKTGKCPFDTKQTLDVMKIRTGVIKAVDCLDKRIKL